MNEWKARVSDSDHNGQVPRRRSSETVCVVLKHCNTKDPKTTGFSKTQHAHVDGVRKIGLLKLQGPAADAGITLDMPPCFSLSLSMLALPSISSSTCMLRLREPLGRFNCTEYGKVP